MKPRQNRLGCQYSDHLMGLQNRLQNIFWTNSIQYGLLLRGGHPLQFKHQAPEIAKVLKLDLSKAKEYRLFHLQKLEEDRVNPIHHQEAQKKQQKSRHDINLRDKYISLGDVVLLYDNRIKGKPKNLETTWLGPYIVEELNKNGLVRLKTLQGKVLMEVVNEARLKSCYN